MELAGAGGSWPSELLLHRVDLYRIVTSTRGTGDNNLLPAANAANTVPKVHLTP